MRPNNKSFAGIFSTFCCPLIFLTKYAHSIFYICTFQDVKYTFFMQFSRELVSLHRSHAIYERNSNCSNIKSQYTRLTIVVQSFIKACFDPQSCEYDNIFQNTVQAFIKTVYAPLYSTYIQIRRGMSIFEQLENVILFEYDTKGVFHWNGAPMMLDTSNMLTFCSEQLSILRSINEH